MRKTLSHIEVVFAGKLYHDINLVRVNVNPDPNICLTLTLSELCAAGEATHLGAADQHNLRTARENRGEFTLCFVRRSSTLEYLMLGPL